MIRKFNYTERRRIPRGRVRITLHRDGEELSFDPRIDLDGIDLPSEARVYLEAWYRTSLMRFACGTAGDLRIPRDRRLNEIESRNVVHFRLKVVDESDRHHRILAVADGIRVNEREEDGGEIVTLLPVSFSEDLGQILWNVRFEAEGPVLELNQNLPGIERLARLDPLFVAAVYPSAVREVLHRILLVEDVDPAEAGGDWWDLWLRFATRLSSQPAPGVDTDPETKELWIEEVVRGFASRHATLDRLAKERRS